MNRLPEDVALEAADLIRAMVKINNIKQVQSLHIDAACKIVRRNAFFTTLQWYKYMRGDNDYV